MTENPEKNNNRGVARTLFEWFFAVILVIAGPFGFVLIFLISADIAVKWVEIFGGVIEVLNVEKDADSLFFVLEVHASYLFRPIFLIKALWPLGSVSAK